MWNISFGRATFRAMSTELLRSFGSQIGRIPNIITPEVSKVAFISCSSCTPWPSKMSSLRWVLEPPVLVLFRGDLKARWMARFSARVEDDCHQFLELVFLPVYFSPLHLLPPVLINNFYDEFGTSAVSNVVPVTYGSWKAHWFCHSDKLFLSSFEKANGASRYIWLTYCICACVKGACHTYFFFQWLHILFIKCCLARWLDALLPLLLPDYGWSKVALLEIDVALLYDCLQGHWTSFMWLVYVSILI